MKPELVTMAGYSMGNEAIPEHLRRKKVVAISKGARKILDKIAQKTGKSVNQLIASSSAPEQNVGVREIQVTEYKKPIDKNKIFIASGFALAGLVFVLKRIDKKKKRKGA